MQELSQDQGMKAEFPSFSADPIRPRTMRHLVAMIGMLVLVFLGLTVSDRPHATEFAGSPAAVTAGHDGDHCPERTCVGGPGHCCASIHGHACCMLREASGVIAAAATQAWGQPRKPYFAGVVTAPVPRPPSHLIA